MQRQKFNKTSSQWLFTDNVVMHIYDDTLRDIKTLKILISMLFLVPHKEQHIYVVHVQCIHVKLV